MSVQEAKGTCKETKYLSYIYVYKLLQIKVFEQSFIGGRENNISSSIREKIFHFN